MNKIKIILVEDHDLFREGICALLGAEKTIEIKGVSSGREAIPVINEFNPDLIIIDVNLPDVNGINLAKRIKSTYHNIFIMIMSNNNFEKNVVNAIRSGANGYITKDISKDDLIKAIQIVAKGNAYFCNNVYKAIYEHISLKNNVIIQESEEGFEETSLSTREKDILKLISHGYTNSEIAEKLYISTHTVAAHRRNLLKKIDVKNTAGLVRYATKLGLLG